MNYVDYLINSGLVFFVVAGGICCLAGIVNAVANASYDGHVKGFVVLAFVSAAVTTFAAATLMFRVQA